ncbi:MAG: hypothetical protein ACYS21_10580, partial [Planctomycetota bacterium]
AGQDIRLGYNENLDTYEPKTLTAVEHLELVADRDITLGGDVTVIPGEPEPETLIIRADADSDDGGDVWAMGKLTTIGGINNHILVYGDNIQVDGMVNSAANIMMDAVDDLTLASNVEADGNIDLYSSDNTTTLGGDRIEATGNITLHNNTELNGGAVQRIEATTGQLYANGSVHKTSTGNLEMFGGSEVPLGSTTPYDYSVSTKEVRVEDGELTIEGHRYVRLDGSMYSSGDMKLAANSDADGLTGYLFHTTGTIESLNGDVDLSAYNSSIYLYGGNATEYVTAGEDILINDYTYILGDRKLDAGDDIVLAGGEEIWGYGHLTLQAGDDLILGVTDVTDHENTPTVGTAGDVDSTGNLVLNAVNDIYAHGTLRAGGGDIEIYSSDDTTYLYGDYITAGGSILLNNTTESYGDITAGQNVTLNGTLELKGTGPDADQEITAVGGQLYANSSVHKTSTGNLEMFGGYNGPLYPDMDYSVKTQNVTVDDGELSIAGNATVRLNGSIYSKYDMWLTANDDGIDSTPSSPGGGSPSLPRDYLVHYSGTIQSLNGDVDLSAQGDSIYLDGGNATEYVSAGGDILLRDDTWVQYSRKLDAGDDVVLAGGEQIQANGSLNIVAGDDILLGVDDVDNHWSNPQNGSAGDVFANGDLTLDAVDDVYAHGNLTATGDITISSSDSTTHLLGNLVEATGNVNLQNNTIAADDVLIHAVQGDVVVGVETETVNPLDYPGIPGLLPGVYTDTYLSGDGDLIVQAGSDVIVGGNLSAYEDLDVEAVDNISVGNAYSRSIEMTADNGNITSGNLKRVYDIDAIDGDLVYNGGYIETDDGDITLTATNGNIAFKSAYAYDNMNMDADGDITAGVVAPTIWVGEWVELDEVVEIAQGGSIDAQDEMILLAGNDIKAKWLNWESS